MFVRTPERQVSQVASASARRTPRPPRRALQVVTVIQGAAFVILLGLDGSALGRTIRIAGVVAVTTMGVASMRRVRPLGRGATAVGLGIAGFVAGAGIGGVYAAKVGLSLVTTAGLTALVTGVWLMVSGATTLVRWLPGWWRVLAIPAALAVIVFVLYPMTVAVNATNRPATPLGPLTPAARGLSYEDVAFLTSDGVRLSAWYVPSRNGAAVVVLHGAGSTRSSVLPQGAVLARHGYGVLLPDTRGHGRSGGDAMDFGWYGDLDIDAAVSYLEGRSDVRDAKIGIVGLSMGGEQAIAAAGVDDRIRSVVAEGVTGMQADDHGWLQQYGFRGSVQLFIDQVMYGTAGVLSGADRPMPLYDAIRAAAPRPLLLIAGAETASEPVAGRWLEQASPGSAELWVVPEAGHTDGLATRPIEWEAKVVGHLDRALLPARNG